MCSSLCSAQPSPEVPGLKATKCVGSAPFLRDPKGNPVRFRSDEMMKRATKKVDWEIPPLTRQARIQGTVVVEVSVTSTGDVDCAVAATGHPMLITGVLKAVRQWKFKPAVQDGKPVSYSGDLVFNLSWSTSMSLLNQ